MARLSAAEKARVREKLDKEAVAARQLEEEKEKIEDKEQKEQLVLK